MREVMIAAGSEKALAFCESLVKEQEMVRLCTALSGSEIRRRLKDQAPDLILINAPLPDESGRDLAVEAAEETGASVILLVKNDIADEIAEQVSPGGVIVVAKPVSRQAFHQAYQMAGILKYRVDQLRKENERLKRRIEELRIIDQAKCCLIETLHMTEQQAHRYIEKHAMDQRTTRGRIAEEILEKYKF